MKERFSFKDIMIIVLLLISIVVIGLNIWNIKGKMNQENTNFDERVEHEEKVEKNLNSISIPGYEGLTLKANSLEQDVSLSNPAQNNCYFSIMLCLEDGTILWESEHVEPGKHSKAIRLNQMLEAGVYKNAVLKYSCYSIQDKEPLNGAETKLTLRVNE